MKGQMIKRMLVVMLLAALGVQISSVTVSADDTETQYRYHRYADEDGNVSLCPYYGGWVYDSTMEIEYTEWMSEPLEEDNGRYSYFVHVYQGNSCKNAGCIEDSCDTNRYVDEDGEYWYYQETRTVTVTKPPTEMPYSETAEAILNAITIEEIEDEVIVDALWEIFEEVPSVEDFPDDVLNYFGMLFLEELKEQVELWRSDQTVEELLDLSYYFQGGKDFALGTSTLNKTVDSADYDAFLDAILANETVTDEVWQSIYDLLYRAEFRPNRLGGTNNHNYPAQNSPDANNPLPWSWSLEDGVLGEITFSHGCRGCMHYANFAMSYVYGDRDETVTVISPYPNGKCCAKDLGHDFTVANVKDVIADAVPGSHVRFNYNSGVHSVVYLGKDAENDGFYYISFLGGGRSSTNMYVGYTTYEAIVDNGGTYVGVWYVSD